MVLASIALPSVAGTHDRENLAQCKSELRKVYGDNTTMKLKSIRRSRAGAQMRIKTIPAGDESRLVTCWIDSEGAANMVDKEGVALVAPAYDTADKVSLND